MKAEMRAHDEHSTLVSIGIPTYNRPRALQRAIDDCLKQTYGNLEIIISDNASTDPEVERVLQNAVASDSRITCYRHAQNHGAMANFGYTLHKANGKYFMWAADDDRREDWMVDTLLRKLQTNPAVVCACVEAQYFDEERYFAVFAEGRSFHATADVSRLCRVGEILRHNYGNLVYGLFRTEAASAAFPFFRENEIAFLLKIVSLGSISVTDRVGFYKKAGEAVVAQARWEMEGGRLPSRESLFASGSEALSCGRYHGRALRPVLQCIASLQMSRLDQLRLQGEACAAMATHWANLVVGWKPRRRQAPPAVEESQCL